MKWAGSVILIFIFSALIGSGWALYRIINIGESASFMLYNGPWRVNPKMDLKNAHQRALIAKVGLFALRETEVIYFTATKDSDGEPLNSKYDYIIEGSVPEARYWSYTIYGEDNFLIPNEGKIYSYNQETIKYTPRDSINPELEKIKQPTYKMFVSSNPQEGNWLPSGDNRQLSITLRLYNPTLEVTQNLSTVPLPIIIKVQ